MREALEKIKAGELLPSSLHPQPKSTPLYYRHLAHDGCGRHQNPLHSRVFRSDFISEFSWYLHACACINKDLFYMSSSSIMLLASISHI
jgi:hypothetical protein